MLRSVRLLPAIAILLVAALVAPATAQDATVQSSLDAFSAIPDTALTSHFDLTEIDFTKEVPSDYAVGAGDILVIDLGNPSGDMNQQIISPQGDIFIPVVGKIRVSGLTSAELGATLQTRMEPYYRNINLAVTVGRVRKMEVQVTGMVSAPGTYLAFGGTKLSQFLQLVNQRFEISPLNMSIPANELQAKVNNRLRVVLPEGSLRRVKVFRNDELVHTVDLAKLLVFGDTNQDIDLRHGDRVHIPAIEKFVIFDSSVPFAGKMELLPGDELQELVKLAGGPDNWAVDATVQVQVGTEYNERFFEVRLSDREIIDLRAGMQPINAKPSKEGTQATEDYYGEGKSTQVDALPAEYRPGAKLQLVGGEMIRMARIEDVVYLTGAWVRPGFYTYRYDRDMIDYIGQAGGFFPGAQEGEARWIRRQGPGKPPIVQMISLKDIMLGTAPVPELRPGDMIYVPTKNNQWNGPTLMTTLLNFGTQIRFWQQQ